MIKDVNGRLRQTKDAIGYNITRAFDAAGSLIGVTDSVGNTLLSGVTLRVWSEAISNCGNWTLIVVLGSTRWIPWASARAGLMRKASHSR